MSSVDVYDAALRMLERYGFGLVLCTAVLWFARVDIILPMVAAHREFLHEMTVTQREISTAVRDQTRLLHELKHDRELVSKRQDTEGEMN